MSARPDHDEYGKRLFADILVKRWITRLDDKRFVQMGGVRAGLDAIILSEDLAHVQCAVEIEAKTYKQMRGAMLDLAWHPAPRKLFVVILAQPQIGSEEKARAHCMFVWERLTKGQSIPFELTVLKGTGADPMKETDRQLLAEALKKLGLLG